MPLSIPSQDGSSAARRCETEYLQAAHRAAGEREGSAPADTLANASAGLELGFPRHGEVERAKSCAQMMALTNRKSSRRMGLPLEGLCDKLEYTPDWPVRCELQVYHATSHTVVKVWCSDAPRPHRRGYLSVHTGT